MALKLYNTLSKQKESFVPLTPGKVKLYACGVTVYDYCHIGHARTNLVFDMVVRYLRWRDYDVTYVRNITDIDDKIIQRAQENDESTTALVERFIDMMYQDFDALNILRPDVEPRATETIPEMLAMIEALIEKGFAYAAENGDVYYRVSQFPTYGKLSGQRIEQLRSGERVSLNEDKEDPLDFVLWKAAKPGEPQWESPWGPGRPGWHIECSAMTKKCLGEHFDIHGGGSDLRFPHHENEIAQSEAANGCHYAKYWLHGGMVQIDGEKMSKSLGNFFVIHDVLKQYRSEVVRYFLLSGHYRSEIHYSHANLRSAEAALTRFYLALRDLPIVAVELDEQDQDVQRFVAAMDDDFNTPEALAVLFDLARQANKLQKHDPEAAAVIAAKLRALAAVLGFLQTDPNTFLCACGDEEVASIDQLVADRDQARAEKNWALSDQIRDQLDVMGIVIEDGADGSSWRRKL